MINTILKINYLVLIKMYIHINYLKKFFINYKYDNYKYDNLENDINRLTHLYEFFDDKNVSFYSITLDNHDFGVTSNSDENIFNINNNFCFNINNKNNIKIVLSLTRSNEWGDGNIKLKMIDDNYINIAYKVKTDISNKFNENDKEN